MPMAVPISLPVKDWATRASDVANMMAAPAPWNPRERLSMSGEVDSPHTSDETENRPSPRTKIRRRPRMSPLTPAVNRNAAKVTV